MQEPSWSALPRRCPPTNGTRTERKESMHLGEGEGNMRGCGFRPTALRTLSPPSLPRRGLARNIEPCTVALTQVPRDFLLFSKIN